jgi:DnaK suppressor protein
MPKPAAKAAVARKKSAAPARAKAAGTKAATGGRKATRATSPASSKGGGKRTKAAAEGRGAGKKAAPADRFLEDQRALLVGEREASVRQAESLRAEAEQLAEEMEPGDTQFDEESGEGGTLNVERERDLALSAQARAAVEEIDRAIGKIEAGTYGTCEQCGQAIPKARLKALPYATLCVSCKSGGLSRR